MTPNQKIELIALRHKLWVHYCKNRLGPNSLYPEDVVQTAYLNILILLHKKPNLYVTNSYMYAVLRNIMSANYKEIDPLNNAVPIRGDVAEEEYIKPKPKYAELKPDIDRIVENFYVFDKKLFNAYRYEFTSIRKLSKVTKIGQRQVFQTVKKCKEKINRELKSKYYGKEK